MKKANKKPTAFEITELIIKAVLAIAALITAIRWWQVNEGRKPLPLGVSILYHSERSFTSEKKQFLVDTARLFIYYICKYRFNACGACYVFGLCGYYSF